MEPSKEEQEKIWLGNEEIGGEGWQLEESGGKRYLRRGSEWREIKYDPYNKATEIEGLGAIERYKGRPSKLGGREISGGDLGKLIDRS